MRSLKWLGRELYDTLKATCRAAIFGFCFGLIFWCLCFGVWGCLLAMRSYTPGQLQLSAVIR
jgi:hypothetical protein